MTEQTVEPNHKVQYIEHGHFLSEIYSELPPGRINKNVTGAGATYLEFECKRSSIIVFPTRALAATKAVQHKSFYIGSEYEGISGASISDILKEMKNRERVKIAVVVDSLNGLLEDLGEQAFHYFHLTLDEADCFQTEIDYRPIMEESLDSYWKFPPDQRTMVSATLQDFSDDRIRKEPLTEIEWLGKPLEDLYIFHSSGDMVYEVINKIRELKQYFAPHKILVAYNSVKRIMEVVKVLNKEMAGDLGVLCGSNSIDKIPDEFKGKLQNGILSRQIMLMTSAFYYGLDINEKLNVLIVTDTDLPQTLVSPSKMEQIYGRARPGCAVKVFLFNTVNASKQRYNLAERDIPALADHLMSLLNKILETPDDVFSPAYKKQICSSIIDGSKIDGLFLIRNSDYDYKIRSLVVDYLCMEQDTIRKIYHDPVTTAETLAVDYYVELYELNTEKNQEQKEIIKELREQSSQEAQERANTFLSKLNDESTFVLLEPATRFEHKQNELISYVAEHSILNKTFFIDNMKAVIDSGMSMRKLNSLHRKAIAYGEYPDGELWGYLLIYFKSGKSYSASSIYENLGLVRDATGDKSLLDFELRPTTAVQWIRNIFCTYKDNRAEDGKNAYRIQSDLSNEILAK